jgi:hypothetical protein
MAAAPFGPAWSPNSRSLDEQIRRAMAMGWSGEEIEMLVVELRRDDSATSSVDRHGFHNHNRTTNQPPSAP